MDSRDRKRKKVRQKVRYRPYLIPSLLCIITFCYIQIALRNVPLMDSRQYWYGDESWLMSEYRSQVTTGEFRYREAKASTLERGSGIVFGSMWITSLLYGVPYAMTGAHAVETGRIVTTILSALMLLVLFSMSRRRGASLHWSLFGVFLLLTSQVFIMTSHSARYDIAVGFGVFLLLIFYSSLLANGSRKRMDYLLLGASLPSALLVNAHILLSIGFAFLYVLIRLKLYADWRRSLTVVLGGAVTLAAIVALYFATNADHTLLGPKSASGFVMNSVSEHLPIARWSSWRLQWSYLGERFALLGQYGIWTEVWAGLLVIGGAFYTIKHKGGFPRNPIYLLALLIVISYLCFETPSMRSMIYVLPTIVFAMIHASDRLTANVGRVRLQLAMICAAAVLLAVSIPVWQREEALGDRMTSASRATYREEQSATGTDSSAVILGSAHASAYLSNGRFMTDLFGWHPLKAVPIETVIQQNGVRYATLLYPYHAKPEDTYFERPVMDYVEKHSQMIEQKIGVFCDYGASYAEGVKPGEDTIRLFQLY